VPVSGLVIVFESSEALNELVVEQLTNHPCLEIGERASDRLAVVVDTASKDHDFEVWEWIGNLPGVSEIKIAFVGFDDEIPTT
jgi:nitrate reductase NapAB chaperone NapD